MRRRVYLASSSLVIDDASEHTYSRSAVERATKGPGVSATATEQRRGAKQWHCGGRRTYPATSWPRTRPSTRRSARYPRASASYPPSPSRTADIYCTKIRVHVPRALPPSPHADAPLLPQAPPAEHSLPTARFGGPKNTRKSSVGDSDHSYHVNTCTVYTRTLQNGTIFQYKTPPNANSMKNYSGILRHSILNPPHGWMRSSQAGSGFNPQAGPEPP